MSRQYIFIGKTRNIGATKAQLFPNGIIPQAQEEMNEIDDSARELHSKRNGQQNPARRQT